MSKTRPNRWWLVVLPWMLLASSAGAQEAPKTVQDFAKEFAQAVAEDQANESTATPAGLRFSFAGTPWRDVIGWLAEEGGLALHVGDLPPGSFTYSDPGTFTHQAAIDRVNLFLLPQGFTLVQSGNLLTVINLADPRSMQQLDAMAELVTLSDLDELGNQEVVKCMFPLGEIEADEAVQELSVLKLMSSPTVLEKTNQLIITDSVAKLKNIRQILEAFVPDEMNNGTIVKSFTLAHVEAEDVLLVARPHMGLATGEMIGIDVSLSADLQGKHIFVTGVEDKVKLLEGLVKAIDVPEQGMSTESGEAELRSHLVEGGNVETVYNVLQTLLAGKTVRLSMDETAGSVVALATPDIQNEIAATVAQLQASEADFEVIPLKTADPYFVISLLEEMLDLPGALDDPDDFDADVPKIDADPGNMRLFVRAKRPQIDQIKKIVEGLDGSTVKKADFIRIFPLKGERAQHVLTTAVKFWREANPVILFRSEEAQTSVSERVINDELELKAMTAEQFAGVDHREQRVLTSNTNDRSPAIRCQLTPRGLLLESEDSAALDLFEDHLRTIAGPVDSTPSPPVVFYLKYTKPNDAVRMLGELIDGGDLAKEGEAGTLVNGYVSSGSSDYMLGTLITSRDGTITLSAGSITVVADTRLNRLIAQGSASEIERIEGYLEIIDKDNSITDIQTYGTSHVIELTHTKADEVADVIRDAFAGRVNESSSKAGQPASPASAAAAAAAAKAAAAEAKQAASKRGGEGKKSGGQSERDLEPKMTIAVHQPSNSLIVTAPEQLYKEVEKLAMSIDQRNERTVEIVAPLNGLLYESVLQQMLLGQEPNRNRTTSSSNRTSSSSSRAPSRPDSKPKK
ncbi:MAG: secretin N-terminal domain-containing protein [Rubripirellula sp.]